MTRSIFGTDGIRGRVNSAPMTPEVALRVGMAAGRYFTRGDHRHRVVIGKDTRLSGYMFEPALAAGFVAVGMDVILVGPMPTPAIGMLTKSLRADIGVMISASHNPYHDNGIKLFGPDGYKLTDEVEAKIQAHLQNGLDKGLVEPEDTGRAKRLEDVQGRYVEFVKSTVSSGVSLDGLKIVIDCANGAAYRVAPTVLWELGAEVVAVGVSPNGFNINDGCGSTNPDYMCEQVVAHGADFGIALDGDADRMVLADENGKVVDGDQVMALIAHDWAKSGRLKGGGIVATVMSNLGLERYLAEQGLQLARTRVGDRYVVEHMRANQFNVGGEQSGHIVLNDFATTGDGLIAALQVLAVAVAEDLPASRLLSRFQPIPQILKNARYAVAEPLNHRAVKAAIEDAETQLGASGRLVIRMSGTEPVVRVMAEGDDPALVDLVVSNICHEVETAA